ncbi:helix-turn-helix domain-containing protein [Chryseolinea sp. H1M3-3]|uniref:helix-turn-helix domain-containing protein n=1 Tax=Chryseolinea sp. H1M3-3 TaxID=3034144 RepID=UPI0023EC4F72|nr:helix-turn-helix domain-containing protein [Chryseolinea sp. H1M3-3]
MNVICLEEKAFYALVEEVVNRLKEKNNVKENKWISDKEAMSLLNIKAKSTLQKLRDEGKIRFSHPQKRIILYDRESIIGYLEENARETFSS